MIDSEKLQQAIDLQQRSYLLLKWLSDAVTNGFIQFETAHAFSSLPNAASAWMAEHIQNLPPETRPATADIDTFARFFSTYLENSFDLSGNPGSQLYSPDAHCFCAMCSWLVEAPNLKTKKVKSGDKRLAGRMRIDAFHQVAAEHALVVANTEIEQLLEDDTNYENASLLAYGLDLFQRMQGIANGPAVLALWRGFAWNRSGSPKRKFSLSAKMILDAESSIMQLVKQHGTAVVQ